MRSARYHWNFSLSKQRSGLFGKIVRGILEKTFCFARKMAKRESVCSEQVSTKDMKLAVSVIREKACCNLEFRGVLLQP